MALSHSKERRKVAASSRPVVLSSRNQDTCIVLKTEILLKFLGWLETCLAVISLSISPSLLLPFRLFLFFCFLLLLLLLLLFSLFFFSFSSFLLQYFFVYVVSLPLSLLLLLTKPCTPVVPGCSCTVPQLHQSCQSKHGQPCLTR